mmetsp:Transcript_19669/g.75533  ORF Transcript_19669/g.75533 Transcript_19669/m.75533 type:complete len:318 (-) Transcript_19669:331-1284(-)
MACPAVCARPRCSNGRCLCCVSARLLDPVLEGTAHPFRCGRNLHRARVVPRRLGAEGTVRPDPSVRQDAFRRDSVSLVRQAAPNQVARGIRHQVPVLVVKVKVQVADVFGHLVVGRVAAGVKRVVAGEQDVQDDAKGPHVARAGIRDADRPDLGSGVRPSAADGAHGLGFAPQACEPKVGDPNFGAVLRLEQDVFGFEIPVGNALGVAVDDPLDQLRCNVGSLRLLIAPLVDDPLEKLSPGANLKHELQRFGVVKHVQERDDRRVVVQSLQHLDLKVKSVRLGPPLVEELDRDARMGLPVGARVHQAVVSFPNLRSD